MNPGSKMICLMHIFPFFIYMAVYPVEVLRQISLPDRLAYLMRYISFNRYLFSFSLLLGFVIVFFFFLDLCARTCARSLECGLWYIS